MFKDTDKTIFVGRNAEGVIYGTWSVKQWEGQEEMLTDDVEIKAFLNRPVPKPGISDGELAGLLISKGYLTQVDVTEAVAAKLISEP